jgi:hypothetical protein
VGGESAWRRELLLRGYTLTPSAHPRRVFTKKACTTREDNERVPPTRFEWFVRVQRLSLEETTVSARKSLAPQLFCENEPLCLRVTLHKSSVCLA